MFSRTPIVAVILWAMSFLLLQTGAIAAQKKQTDDKNKGPSIFRIEVNAFKYLGAFRLPGGDIPPRTFAYGGNAMTFNADGDHGGASDGFPGSLFIMGHDRQAWGSLPDGNQVAEISIPAPIINKKLESLPHAAFIQDFHDVAAGSFTALEEIPRVGMHYLNHPATGPKIHLCWGQHMQFDETPSHAWINSTLKTPDLKGTWFIGRQNLYSVNGYLFGIPEEWADAYTGGRYIATGRMRDGGWSGRGPALFAYHPWIDEKGTPAPAGTRLEEIALLRYESSLVDSSVRDRSMNGYQHPDEWEGGAWLTTPSGKSAVLFAGTKGTGAKYWYGWINPVGQEHPCVDIESDDRFALCRLADGRPCPEEDFGGCKNHNNSRGWWSSEFQAQFILYDTHGLAQVSSGRLPPWAPQPYAFIILDPYLFHNPHGVETEMLSTGKQRRYRLGDVAYDPDRRHLFVLELFADGAKPVVHVWKVQD